MDSSHFYFYTFIYVKNMQSTYVNATMRQSHKTITANNIQEAKESANVPADAVVMNISYLGYMTVEEFLG